MQVKKILLGAICVLSMASLSAVASTTTIKEKIVLHDMECSTFIKMNSTDQAKIVYWSAAHSNGMRDSQDVYIDVKGIDNAHTSIVEHCKQSPGSNFYETVKIKYKN